MAVAGKVNETPLEEKAPEDEPVVYPSKQVGTQRLLSWAVDVLNCFYDYRFAPLPAYLSSCVPFSYSIQEAKNAFKALLESVNVQSDWTWEQVLLQDFFVYIYTYIEFLNVHS